MERTKLYYLFFLLFFLSGCITYGRDFGTAPVRDIKLNVTAQKEIFNYFGEPFRRGVENGYETWSYSYHVYSPGQGWKTKELYVVFNKDQTVRQYSYTAN